MSELEDQKAYESQLSAVEMSSLALRTSAAQVGSTSGVVIDMSAKDLASERPNEQKTWRAKDLASSPYRGWDERTLALRTPAAQVGSTSGVGIDMSAKDLASSPYRGWDEHTRCTPTPTKSFQWPDLIDPQPPKKDTLAPVGVQRLTATVGVVASAASTAKSVDTGTMSEIALKVAPLWI